MNLLNPRRTQPTNVKYIVLMVVLTVIAIVWYLKNKPQPEVARSAKSKNPAVLVQELTLATLGPDSELPRNVRPNFVGPQACAECHLKNFEGFQQTKHPFTCREVTPEKMPTAGFQPDKMHFHSVFPEVQFEMSREGSNFVQTSIHTINGVSRRTRSNLDLVLGAGGVADDVFLSWKEDGKLWELPMAWLYPGQEWAASHFDLNSGGEFSRAMTPRCVECHNTWVEHVPGTVNQFRREGAILGVTCEVCHGPAGSHVEFHRAHPGQASGQHIVAATKLSRERSIEVCTQCHSNAMRPKGAAFSYKPGNPLADSFKTLPTQATEDDRVANQISYLRQSRCFQAVDEMTCVTCHNPHQPNNATNSGSASCKKCHTQATCQTIDRLPDEVRLDCVSCHMPSYLKININFQTAKDNYVPPIRRTEHRIAVYQHAHDETLLNYHKSRSDATSQEQVKLLTSRLLQHFEQEVSRCKTQYRFLGVIAALREIVRIQDTAENQLRLREAVQLHEDLDNKFSQAMKQIRDGNPKQGRALFEEILTINPRDSKANGRLGTEYAKTGEIAKAKQHLELVAQIDPNDSYGYSMLGWIAYLEGNFEASLSYHEKAEELEPGEAKIKFQKGLTLIRLKRNDEAIASLQKTLEIEPLHSDALPALVQGLLQFGRAAEALPYAERAARATDLQNLRVVSVLAEVYRSAGMNDRAAMAYQRAINLAPQQDPSLLPQLRQALIALLPSQKK
jgi:tetratricopeptide (TPR) repeat protein